MFPVFPSAGVRGRRIHRTGQAGVFRPVFAAVYVVALVSLCAGHTAFRKAPPNGSETSHPPNVRLRFGAHCVASCTLILQRRFRSVTAGLRDYGGQVLYGTSSSRAKFRGPQLVHHGVSGLAVVVVSTGVRETPCSRHERLSSLCRSGAISGIASSRRRISKIFANTPSLLHQRNACGHEQNVALGLCSRRFHEFSH